MTEEADAFLHDLESDPNRRDIAARVHSQLQHLALFSGDRVYRQRMFSNGLFAFPIVIRFSATQRERLMVLWEPDDEYGVIVHYLGPEI